MSDDPGLGQLGILPYTVREEVYEYLLKARNARIYASELEGLQRRMNGDPLYAFQLSIMRTSRSVSQKPSSSGTRNSDFMVRNENTSMFIQITQCDLGFGRQSSICERPCLVGLTSAIERSIGSLEFQHSHCPRSHHRNWLYLIGTAERWSVALDIRSSS